MSSRESREAAERLRLEVAPGEAGAPSTDDRSSGVVPCGRPEATNQATNQGEPRDGAAGAAEARAGRAALGRESAREVVMLAWPIAAAMLGETAIGLVDTKLVGGLGPGALGGVGIATTTMFLSYALVFGLMRGVKVRTAHAFGEGRDRDGSVYARAGLLLGGAIGLVVLALCRDVSGLLLRLGTDPGIVPYASDFLAAVTLGAPATCALAALIQHRQAIGDSRTPMVVGLAGNLVNALLGWALIYGRLGLPALGVRGGGYATALTECLELAAMVALFARDERRASAEPSRLSLGEGLRGICDLGLPIGLQYLAEMLAFATFTAVLGGIGKDEIAAHQIALNVIRVSFLPGVAIAEAASVLVGRALGARDLEQADRVTRSALLVAVGFMATCGVGFALGGGAVASFFTGDAAVSAIATRLLLVASVFQVLDAVNIVLRGALRGAKDVRVVALFGIAVVWTFIPTSAWLLGKHLGLGALGGWLGFIGETTLGAAVFWLRWRRGAWRHPYP